MHIRPLIADDRTAVGRITTTCGAFTADEETVCLELIDATLAGSDEYEVVVAADGENVVGFLTYGTDPIGEGVWEVYWIVTDPALQNRGVGSALLSWLHDHVEGRMILIETGGKPAYENQRRFYEKNGYREVARVKDFYTPGDDLVVFRRDLILHSEAPSRGRVAEAAR
jgi:ribosomal protein S18 acetylase RimI-like enzyme